MLERLEPTGGELRLFVVNSNHEVENEQSFIQVNLVPFTVAPEDEERFDLVNPEIDTEVILDWITFRDPHSGQAVREPAGLAGRVFHFPRNPEEGYIDGSIYIEPEHHPFDVTEIQFGELNTASIRVSLRGHFVAGNRGDLQDQELTFETVLQVQSGADAASP